MTINDLHLSYDGVCIYATTVVKVSVVGKLILFLFSFVILGAVFFFSIEKIYGASVVFLIAEVFVIKYTLWNLYGEERVIINSQSISHQYYYGFFTTPYHTISFNRKLTVYAYEEIVEGDQTYVRYHFRSFNSKDLPEIVYQSTLSINKIDFEKLIEKTNQLFVDHLSDAYAFPAVNLN